MKVGNLRTIASLEKEARGGGEGGQNDILQNLQRTLIVMLKLTCFKVFIYQLENNGAAAPFVQ